MRSSCSIRRTAAAGSLPVISGQSLGRLISPWSASAAIHPSWHFGRPTVERCRHRCSTETPLPINLSLDEAWAVGARFDAKRLRPQPGWARVRTELHRLGVTLLLRGEG